MDKLNSNLFKFKYFYLITELRGGCYCMAAGRRCCLAGWLSLAGCLLLLARFNHD
jgi:hypothetical protein